MAFRLTMALAIALLAATGCSNGRSDTAGGRMPGWQLKLGEGTASSYAGVARDGTPNAIGVAWSAGALDKLAKDSDHHRCFGRTPDGAIDAATRCQHSHEFVIPLPDAVARRDDVPFKWVLLNWNPEGHIPPGIYDVPHFDVHFEMGPIADVFAIEPGPCGPQFRKQPFTRSWIYGAYDGKLIFHEAMVAHAYLLAKPNDCAPIKAPRAVAAAGWYRTEYCIRHDAATGETLVSMEKFTRREASAPEPIPAQG